MIKKWWYPPILAYHRIHPQPAPDTPTLTPEIFERQISILAKRWNPVGLNTLVSHLEKGPLIPRKNVVVTFDDGTEDTFTYAFPILERYRIPAIIFMIADNVGKPSFLNPEQILTMHRSGIQFGSHTVHHAYLPSLSMEQARQELMTSKQTLQQIGIPVEFLSYPAGGFTPEILQMTKEVGYRAACTTNRCIERFPINPWALRRITMHAKGSSPLGIWIRCNGYYGLNRRLRSPA